jgi:hypothetical protein
LHGYDPEVFFPIEKDDNNKGNEFECDISMNVYNIMMDTYVIIDTIIKYCIKHKKNFNIYGMPVLRDKYSEYYKGDVTYDKQNYIYNYSKINILTTSFNGKSVFISNQITPILGSGGLLLINSNQEANKVLVNNKNCVIYNSQNLVEKMHAILSNYSKYDNIRKNASETAKSYTWENFVNNIMKEYGNQRMNTILYKKLYQLPDNIDIKEYWNNTGYLNKHVCYDFNVPAYFDSEEYILANSLENDVKLAYYHWFTNSKSRSYIKKNKNKNKNMESIDINKLNIINEEFYDICSIFNKINNYNTTREGLDELGSYCKKIHNLNVNEILDKYNISIM